MARKCPNCFTVLPATKLLTHSTSIECRSCKSPLEFSAFSRNLSSFASLIFAAIVFRISQAYYSGHPGALGWVFPVLFAYLGYSIAAPILLVFIADLQLRPFEPAPVDHAPSSAHHGSH